MSERADKLLERLGLKMSKGVELRDLQIEELSGVSSAANGFDGWLLLKSADSGSVEMSEALAEWLGSDKDVEAFAELLVKAYGPGFEEWPDFLIEDAIADALGDATELRKALQGGEVEMGDYYDLTGSNEETDVIEMLKHVFPGFGQMTVDEATQFTEYLEANPHVLDEAMERRERLRKSSSDLETAMLDAVVTGYSRVDLDAADADLPNAVIRED